MTKTETFHNIKVGESTLCLNISLFTTNILLLFFIFIQEVIPIKIFTFADEILTIISFILIIIYSLKTFLNRGKIPYVYFAFFVLILYSFFNYFISPFSDSFLLMVLQNLLSLKSFVILLGFIILYQNKTIYNQIIEFAFFLFLFLFISSLVGNFILGESWNEIVKHPVKYRYGILRPAGILGGSGNMGSYFAITFTTLVLIIKYNYIRKHPYKFFIALSAILILSNFILTVRKPLLMIIPIGLFIRKYINRIHYYMFISLISVFFAGYVILSEGALAKITKQNLEHFTDSEDNTYIRGLMFLYSIDLAKEKFPFGTSPATFGSNLSQLNTMNVYEYKGITDLEWLYNEQGNLKGVYDSGLGSLIAEYGFLGSILIIVFIIYFFKFLKNMYPIIYPISYVILIYLLISTLFAPSIMNDMQSCFISINVLYLLTKQNKIQINENFNY